MPWPSLGSATHALGICKPCDFQHRTSCRHLVGCTLILLYVYNMYIIHVMYLYVVCLCYMFRGYIYTYILYYIM